MSKRTKTDYRDQNGSWRTQTRTKIKKIKEETKTSYEIWFEKTSEGKILKTEEEEEEE